MSDNIVMRELQPRIELAKMARDEKVMTKAKSLIVDLVNVTKLLTKKDIAKWRQAWQIALSVENPKRTFLYDVYDDNLMDNHLLGAIRNRKLKVIGKPFKLVDKKTSVKNPELTELLRKRWFKKLLNLALDSIYWGHSLIELGDVVADENGLRFSDVKLVPRRHVSPEYGMLLKNISDEASKGIDYRKFFADWILEVYEDDTDLGLLNAVSHQCISKRNALAFWDQFSEIFGMPVRIGKTLSRDQKDIDKISSMLDQMGSAAYGVFPEGTVIDIIESSKGDSFNVYDKRIERANSEMSKAIMGQTMTMDSGSSRSQAEVHESVSDEIAKADGEFLADIINDKLLPLLNKHGFGMESVRFDWDETYELTPIEMLEVEKLILQYYDVDPVYFIEKHNIPIIGIRSQGTPADPAKDPAQKKKPDQVKLSSFIALVSSGYTTCPDCGGAIIQLAFDGNLDAEADRIARAIFNGDDLPGDIMPEVAGRVAAKLREAITEGYGKDFTDIDYKSPDFRQLSHLERNVYQFSVAKNYQELKQVTGLLKDGDRVRSFGEFKTEVLKLHSLFNNTWMQAEYNLAVNGSAMASKWTDFQKNKEALPYLIYQTVGDARVRDSHKALDGVQRNIDDDFWKTHYPPNDWNCRCTVNQTGQGSETPTSKIKYPTIKPMFRTNLAEAGLVYPKDHPYFIGIPNDVLKKALFYLPESVTYRTIATKSGSTFEVHMMRDALGKELKIADTLANNGNKVKLLPEVDRHEKELRKMILPDGVHENKNPDALINNFIFDFKTIKGSKKSVQHIIDNIDQSANYAIEIPEGTDNDILRYMKGALMHKVRLRLPFDLNQIWIIKDGNVTKYWWDMESISFKATKD